MILTPSWAWHDHGNETKNRVVWMDGLDIPLIASLEAMFFQFYSAPQVPASRPPNTSGKMYGHAHITPTWVKEKPQSSPLLLYSWDEAWKALDSLREHEGSAHDGVLLEYRHPQTGGPVLPTMACMIQLLRPGKHTQAHRHTGSAVYHVVQGAGFSVIDGQRFNWQKGDFSPYRRGRSTSMRMRRRAPTPCCSRSKICRCFRLSASTTKKRSQKMTATSL